MHHQMYSRMNPPVPRESRKQRVNRAFVHAEGNLAALQSAQFPHALADLFAQIQHAVGVLDEQKARVGQRRRARAANEQRLPHPLLKLANRDAHGGLRPVKLFGGSRKASLANDSLKYLQRRQIHDSSSKKLIRLYKRDLYFVQSL